MRKRRRLVDKLTIMVCAVLVAVSAFFYAPMEVSASPVSSDYLFGSSSQALAYSDITFNASGAYPSYGNVGNYFVVDIPIPLFAWAGGRHITCNGNVTVISFNDNFYPSIEIISNSGATAWSVDVTSVSFCFNNQEAPVDDSDWFTASFDSSVYEGRTITSSCYLRVRGNYTLSSASDNAFITCRFSRSFSDGKQLIFNFYDNGLSSSVDLRNQTNSLNQNANKNTDSIVNGFDSSQGDSVNSDLSAGLNDFQTAEDSLFATASSGLDDFSFFNFASIPAMVTGMSFVSSIMTSWFNQAGGASGVGIVLSILFSIMLVAMVLGLYRWYQSKGGKD